MHKLCICICVALLINYVTSFTLSIIHINDFHARFEETSELSNDCNPGQNCIGGYSRLVSMVKHLNSTATNPVYLNAGDNFQGTLWYTIGRYNVTNQFLNMLPVDAQTIGNHEFDHDIEGVVPFLLGQKAPVLIANIDDSEEPDFQGTYNKSMILEKYGQKIGIIGVILRSTNTMAKTGKLRFLNEASSVRTEAQALREKGVDKIIVISHCGLDRDREIARDGGPDIDIIVGGHSHTLLYTGTPPFNNASGEYPVVVNQTNGHQVLIVQASALTKYVGFIRIEFDDSGEIVSWEGNPVFLSNAEEKDVDVEAALIPWRETIDEAGKRVIGKILFDAPSSGCYQRECLMGSIQADSMAYSAFNYENDDDSWAYSTIGITNPGGVRASLTMGDVTYSNIVATTPFENTCDKLEVQGKFLREALEYSVANASNLFILQTSGIQVVFNMTKPSGQRVHSFKILCRICEIPRYVDVEDETWYRAIMTNFLLTNGDNYDMIKDNMRNHEIGEVDIDALENFIQKNSPITILPNRRRVRFIN